MADEHHLNLAELLPADSANRDLLGVFLFGWDNFDAVHSSSAAFRATLRRIVLAISNRPQDGRSDLRFCAYNHQHVVDNARSWYDSAYTKRSSSVCTQLDPSSGLNMTYCFTNGFLDIANLSASDSSSLRTLLWSFSLSCQWLTSCVLPVLLLY